jgi:hypothetical protein
MRKGDNRKTSAKQKKSRLGRDASNEQLAHSMHLITKNEKYLPVAKDRAQMPFWRGTFFCGGLSFED